MHALQKKCSSTSILVEPLTEWQSWLTSLGNQKVLLMWNLLKLKLLRKLLSWTNQNCMVANSRCESWYFLLLLRASTSDGRFIPILHPSLYSSGSRWHVDITTLFSHQVAPKRTNVPGMKQPRGRGFNPYHAHPYMRPYGYSPHGYGWVVYLFAQLCRHLTLLNQEEHNVDHFLSFVFVDAGDSPDSVAREDLIFEARVPIWSAEHGR